MSGTGEMAVPAGPGGEVGTGAASGSSPQPAGDREYLMTTYPDPPVTFVQGVGAYLIDVSGKRYLDFFSGIAVTSLGHAHPAVTEAISAQAARLSHVSNLFGNIQAAPLAAKIDALIGDGTPAGGRVFFANSGAEANECAIKLARKWGGGERWRIVSTTGSFHGRTLATWSATGKSEALEAFRPLPAGFEHIPYDDLEALKAAVPAGDVAGFIVEPIQGENGIVEPSPGYLAAARAVCAEAGVLFISDEVQSGLGRTGRWFGFQRSDLAPDIVTMAKALGNGFPIGACWARAEVADRFVPGDHGSTYGGQPLACAAAMATLKAMEEMNAPEKAASAGARLAEALEGVPGVVRVRGKGLLLGVVLDGDYSATAASLALARGLVVNPVRPETIRLSPPLVITDGEIDSGCEILAAAIGQARSDADGA